MAEKTDETRIDAKLVGHEPPAFQKRIMKVVEEGKQLAFPVRQPREYPFQRQLREAFGNDDGTFIVGAGTHCPNTNCVTTFFLWQMLHGAVARASEEECEDVRRLEDNRTCYNCKHSFATSGAPDFIGDEPDVISDGQTCWYECRKGHEITDGEACDEWEQAENDNGAV